MDISPSSEKQIHRLFQISIVSKAIFAVFDIIGATFLLLFGTHAISRALFMISQGELLEDPNSSIAQLALRLLHVPHPHVTTFVILYLFAHGTINTIFAIGLLQEKLWAYRFAIIAMGTFLCYQAYRLLASPSPWMIILTLFDLGVMLLVVHEYRLHTKT